jgi:hypothetical protein
MLRETFAASKNHGVGQEGGGFPGRPHSDAPFSRKLYGEPAVHTFGVAQPGAPPKGGLEIRAPGIYRWEALVLTLAPVSR